MRYLFFYKMFLTSNFTFCAIITANCYYTIITSSTIINSQLKVLHVYSFYYDTMLHHFNVKCYMDLVVYTNYSNFYRFLSKNLGNRFDHCAEAIFPTLIALIQNSAKIMASSGLVAITLIIQVRKGF